MLKNNNSIKKLYKLFSKIDYIMISNKEVKRSFKVVLDSYNTNSYTGSEFNAHYYIDLLRLINDDKAFIFFDTLTSHSRECLGTRF